MSDLPQRIARIVERQNDLDARISALEKLTHAELVEVWEIFSDCARIFQAQTSFNADVVALLAPAFPEADFTGYEGLLVDIGEALKKPEGG